jgi:hypothetical protein
MATYQQVGGLYQVPLVKNKDGLLKNILRLEALPLESTAKKDITLMTKL